MSFCMNLGTYSLNITSLRDPPDLLRVREVKEWHVELLMKLMEGKEGYCDHEELTAPLLVLCSVSKQEFRLKSLNNYTYQVVGGNPKVQCNYSIAGIMQKGHIRKTLYIIWCWAARNGHFKGNSIPQLFQSIAAEHHICRSSWSMPKTAM